MADVTTDKDIVFEDISSSSKTKNVGFDDFAEKGFKNIDKIIKSIAYILAICVLVIFLALAAVVFLMDKSFYLVSVLIIAVGLALALVVLFLTYGLGHIISQNKEILKRL